MSTGGCEKFIQKIHNIFNFHWSKTIESGGNSNYEINVFLQCILATIIGTPRNSNEKNISEVYSYSYLLFF